MKPPINLEHSTMQSPYKKIKQLFEKKILLIITTFTNRTKKAQKRELAMSLFKKIIKNVIRKYFTY